MASKINDGTLKPQTDSKERNPIFTGIPGNHYLSLNTPISETAGNKDPIYIMKDATDIPGFFKFFCIDPFYFYLGIIFNSGMNKSLDDTFIGIMEPIIFATEGYSDTVFWIIKAFEEDILISS